MVRGDGLLLFKTTPRRLDPLAPRAVAAAAAAAAAVVGAVGGGVVGVEHRVERLDAARTRRGDTRE